MGGSTRTAAASASSLILLQMGARLLTFVLNQLLVRLVPASVFGAANIQLELLLSTILFLSREAVRNVLVRRQADESSIVPSGPSEAQGKLSEVRSSSSRVHNISLLPIPVGLGLSLVVAYLYLAHLSPASLREATTFKPSVWLYVLGALAELFYEPLHIRALALGHPALRVQAEGVAIGAKCVTSIVAVLALPSLMQRAGIVDPHDQERSVGLLAFGLGQVCYGLAMLLVYAQWFLRRDGLRQTLALYVVRATHSTRGSSDGAAATAMGWLGNYLDLELLSLCWSMTKQGLLKHALTEGDKLAVARFASLEDQGGYALASNYGSLVARLLFQPIEDTSRLVFAQSMHSIETAAADKDGTAAAPASISSATALDEVSSLISTLFRAHFLLGMTFVCFGAPLATAFLYIMAGPRWALTTSAPAILGAYAWYIPVMGVNGIAEGFLQSTASKRQVERYNKVLVAASGIFAASLWLSHALLSGSKETLLVWTNAFSLGVRATYCWSFLVRYFDVATRRAQGSRGDAGQRGNAVIVERLRPSAVLPSRLVLASFAGMFLLLRTAAPLLMPRRSELLAAVGGRLVALRMLLPVLAFGAVCLGFLLAVCAVFEGRTLVGTLSSLHRRRSPGQQGKKIE
ncbi:Oligosaccharide translocation protein rft1 [Thecaphora frezii]